MLRDDIWADWWIITAETDIWDDWLFEIIIIIIIITIIIMIIIMIIIIVMIIIWQYYIKRCELLIIPVHMTYISVRWLQTVYILICVLCTVCILRTEGRQYAQFWKYANCCVFTARRAAKVGWCWTGRETEDDRWGDCNMHSLVLDQSLIRVWLNVKT